MFDASSGGCTDTARGAIRLDFHDAAAWSLTPGFGGADGSILLTDKLTRFENLALVPVSAQFTASILAPGTLRTAEHLLRCHSTYLSQFRSEVIIGRDILPNEFWASIPFEWKSGI